jgi:hypothetical protein
VRTIGLASTRSSKLGDTVAAAIDVPVVVNGRIVVARGSGVTLRIVSMDEGISLALSTLTIGGRHYNANAEPLDFEAGGKSKKGVLGRVGGLVHKKRGESGEASVMPETRMTFTLRTPIEAGQ